MDLRYIVSFHLIVIKGIFETSGGYLFVTLEQFFFITSLLRMVILLILHIWFHHMDTILVVLLVCLNLYNFIT